MPFIILISILSPESSDPNSSIHFSNIAHPDSFSKTNAKIGGKEWLYTSAANITPFHWLQSQSWIFMIEKVFTFCWFTSVKKSCPSGGKPIVIFDGSFLSLWVSTLSTTINSSSDSNTSSSPRTVLNKNVSFPIISWPNTTLLEKIKVLSNAASFVIILLSFSKASEYGNIIETMTPSISVRNTENCCWATWKLSFE